MRLPGVSEFERNRALPGETSRRLAELLDFAEFIQKKNNFAKNFPEQLWLFNRVHIKKHHNGQALPAGHLSCWFEFETVKGF